ncbi:hypothetical protein HK104_009780 [Borealophlyctis nickersoniae]|nr:hypothetical protein HK104_009780 [Borealophlyctis nickersoniae]
MSGHPVVEGPVKIAIIGAGERGKVYGSFALDNPHLCEVVAVAEKSERRRKYFTKRHGGNIPHVYNDWRDLAKQPKLADAAVICLQDQMHAECIVALAAVGYHIMCEKPMAITPVDCATIAHAVLDAKVIFAVGHVLRYSPYNRALKNLLASGAIGDIINVQHLEDQKPVEAGDATRCIDCTYERDCPYSAPKLYLDQTRRDERGWPATVICDGVEPDIESINEGLRTGPYGMCVYEAPNDVCDHQVVNIEFEGGRTASFTMVAFTDLVCERQTRIHGTRGEIIGDSHTITISDFSTKNKTVVKPAGEVEGIIGSSGGHGGGDYGLMHAFVQAVKYGDESFVGCTPREALLSHALVFAAEEARKSGTVVDVQAYMKERDCMV